MKQSLLFLGIQHASRLAQEKTRRELGGPFLRDWQNAAGNLQWKWSDEDGILTNYVGHPMIGAVAGYLQVFNDPVGRNLIFDHSSKDYWASRLRALAWSAAYSTQFELGPLGEAAIGNVGKIPPTQAMVDLVMTPAGGFGLILLEDYLDRRFISRWEEGTSNVLLKKFYRLFFNPNRSLANMLRFRRPSHRGYRPIEQ
ncbi:MAG: hypothetical protein HY648_12350 [Acidobacteria bacterium]|nr:hypothetical protein [Acidobacteriota bacterium]